MMNKVSYIPGMVYPDVVTLDPSVYREALMRTVETVRKNVGKKCAFYNFGKVRTPGVSDLDLLVVAADDECRSIRECLVSLIGQSGILSYLYEHSPIVVPESCVPYLGRLHTLYGCSRVDDGDWTPEYDVCLLSPLQDCTTLVRHGLWNGFFRLTASQMESKCIGLRESLGVLHNFTMTAQRGNLLLSDPLPLNFSTEQIRQEILSSAWHVKEALVRKWIATVVDAMNEVDNRLDLQLMPAGREGKDHTLTGSFWLNCVVSPLNVTVRNVPRYRLIMGGRPVVPLPRYVFCIMSETARMSRTRMPLLRTFHGQENSATTIDLFQKGIAEILDAVDNSVLRDGGLLAAVPVLGATTRLSRKYRGIIAIRRQVLARAVAYGGCTDE